MKSMLSIPAAAEAASSTSSAEDIAKNSDKNVKSQAKRKFSSDYFLVLSEDISSADIELEDEVFSGFEMVVLLLDEIEDYMRNRRGTIKGVTKLFARRGIEFSERTVKDYITKARKLRKGDAGNAVEKLRESIFEAARKSGRSVAGRAACLNKTPQDSALPAPETSQQTGEALLPPSTAMDASEAPSAQNAPAEESREASAAAMSEAAGTPDASEDFCLPGADWLDEAVRQAFDDGGELQPELTAEENKQSAGAASAAKGRAGRKHNKRRPHRR